MKTSRSLFPLFLLLLAACTPAGLLPAGTATGTPVSASEAPIPSPLPSLLASPLASPLPQIPVATNTPPTHQLAERVLIISFDGLRPGAIGKAPMTNLIGLMQNSAYSFNAQTILPSSTLPSHASMLTGLCPAGHGVYWNDLVPENGYALGVNVFDLAHSVGMRTVMVVGKEKLRQIVRPESTDVFIFKEADSTIGTLASAEIRQGFGLMFVHFPTGDILGHEWGWMGGVQMWAFREEDKFLGQMLAALDESGLRQGTLIILSADHGGFQKSHGGDSPEETSIPWIVSGPGVIPGPLSSFIQTTDTAATAAYMLGLPLPPDWDGMPVYEAFGQPTPVRIPGACLQTR